MQHFSADTTISFQIFYFKILYFDIEKHEILKQINLATLEFCKLLHQNLSNVIQLEKNPPQLICSRYFPINDQSSRQNMKPNYTYYVLGYMNDMTLAFFAFFLFWDKLQYHILVQELLHLHGFLASYPRGFKELCLDSTAWA